MGGAALDISTLTLAEPASFLCEINRQSRTLLRSVAIARHDSDISVEWHWSTPTFLVFHPAKADAEDGREDATPRHSHQSLFVTLGKKIMQVSGVFMFLPLTLGGNNIMIKLLKSKITLQRNEASQHNHLLSLILVFLLHSIEKWTINYLHRQASGHSRVRWPHS